MKCIPFNPENLAQAVQILKDGGVIAHPADTCYGLAADFRSPAGKKRLQEIKGRDGKNPMSIMLPAFMKADLADYAELDDFARMVADKLLPGPVTLLLPKGPEIPADYFPETPYIGIRIPYDALTQDILTAFKGPLITTSANISDEPALSTCGEVIKSFATFKTQPDLVFEGAVRNVCMPSTIVVVENGKVRLYRKGPMSQKQIEGILGVTLTDD